jgi:putative addiction module killer protein
MVTHTVLIKAMQVLYYIETSGRSPFADWFDGLSREAVAKIAVALKRMEQGNLSNTKSVGQGVLEYRIDFGPGYRVYFGCDGKAVVILLAGGTKHRQQRDIAAAKKRWADYKRRKANQ